MAEEIEKKPGFVVHKKQQEATPASAPEKKRVLVVKKKAPAPQPQAKQPAQNQASANGNGAQKARVVVKKVDSPIQAPAKQEAKPAAQKPQQRQDPRPRTFELNSARPNVKAGNLSDRPRQGGYNRGGQGGNGYNRDRNANGGQGGNRPYNREGGSGFSGAQARQSYQNRERDGQGGFNRGGQGGFNRNGGGQGGFNRGGQGGFNRGPGMGGQGGFRGPRPGMGGGAGVVPPVDQSRQPAKKAFKGKKQIYNRKDEEQYDDKFFEQKKKNDTPATVVPKSIDIMETISVSDLARKMNLKASEVIGKLMGMGMMVTITQSIDADTATLLAAEYGCEVHLVSLYDETVIESEKDDGVELLPRPPIVTVMGHVDHGKTKTLDAIRHSHVAEGEAGGITQSIGAYSVKTEKGTITFLDTPGHEAFTMMRARGAQVTDIVVLVVAADDGVMPQTLEAISHAKDAKVPIIVAVNKVDKPEANPDRVKTQLSERGLTPEEWGGDTQYVHISALKKEGIDDLLDAILLQAEMLELKANNQCRAEGKILESRVDQGRGVVSTVIIQRGTLHQGDPFVAGIYSGRVRAMFDDRGKRIQEAGPSIPVEVLGIEEMPNAGDPFQVTESEKDARAISAKRQELKRFEEARAVKKVTLENFNESIKDSEMKELKVIIKADLQGSAEALKSSLEKLSTREIRLSVIHSSAGAINESDVTLAAADSNAIIIGFNVRPTPKAKILADQERVEIRKYNIIYKCVEEIQAAMEGMLQPDTKEEVIGMVEVRDTFKVPKVGVIAGCSVSEGIVRRTASVNLVRDGIVIFTGKISSLKRFKDDVKEVSVGYECGIGLENWQDIQVGDRLEVFEIIEVAKKLGKTLAEEQAEIEKRNVTGEASADKE
ncbi:MAG: translation initiation factor IF-2 [Treponema sp.]|nr:translation initiation factor IF-2 [Treponema sp.]